MILFFILLKNTRWAIPFLTSALKKNQKFVRLYFCIWIKEYMISISVNSITIQIYPKKSYSRSEWNAWKNGVCLVIIYKCIFCKIFYICSCIFVLYSLEVLIMIFNTCHTMIQSHLSAKNWWHKLNDVLPDLLTF